MRVKAEMEARLKDVCASFERDRLTSIHAIIEISPGALNPLQCFEQKLRLSPRADEAAALFKLIRGRIPRELTVGYETIQVPPDNRECVSLNEIYRVKEAFEAALIEPDDPPVELARTTGRPFVEEVEDWVKLLCLHHRGLFHKRIAQVRQQQAEQKLTCAYARSPNTGQVYSGCGTPVHVNVLDNSEHSWSFCPFCGGEILLGEGVDPAAPGAERTAYKAYVVMWWTAGDEKEFEKQKAEVEAAGGFLIDWKDVDGVINWRFVIEPEVAKAKWNSTEEDFLE